MLVYQASSSVIFNNRPPALFAFIHHTRHSRSHARHRNSGVPGPLTKSPHNLVRGRSCARSMNLQPDTSNDLYFLDKASYDVFAPLIGQVSIAKGKKREITPENSSDPDIAPSPRPSQKAVFFSLSTFPPLLRFQRYITQIEEPRWSYWKSKIKTFSILSRVP